MNVLLNPSLVGLKQLSTARTGAGGSGSLCRLGAGRIDEMPGLEMSFVGVTSRKAARRMAGHFGGAVVEGTGVGLLLRVLF